jgi:3-oxoacyl-(acyl-carrier-protein) synthase
VGAEIPDFDLKEFAPQENVKRWPRHNQFGLAAAILALKDAGLTKEDLAGRSPIIVTGTTMMDFESVTKTVQYVAKKGPKYGLSSAVNQALAISIADRIASYLETPSRILSLQTACCSGLDALGQGADFIATGQSDFVICGGSEAPLFYHPMLELSMAELAPRSHESPTEVCRPFDLWRTTGVFGEGAALFVLEPENSPRPGYAFISGYGYANDHTDHIDTGWKNSMRMALANAKRSPREIDFISAWAPGHKRIDATEAYALRQVFGESLDHIPVASIKGSIGSPMAAAGAIQVASTALAMRNGVIPPTVNWKTPDPDCALNLSDSSRRIQSNIALVNGHGISGNNSGLVIERT